MANPIIKKGVNLGIRVAKKGAKLIFSAALPAAIDLGGKFTNEIIEGQKNRVKVPNLKDVHIEKALKILKEDYNLNPTSVVAKPKAAYAYESENEVMYTEPKCGSRLNPKSMVKVFYLTQETIDASKVILSKKVQEFELPRIIGLNIDEAQEDLQSLGLKVTVKLEKADMKFINKEQNQVTRATYPNDHKIKGKLKVGERVWVYFINEEVINEIKLMKELKEKANQERIEKIVNVGKDGKKKVNVMLNKITKLPQKSDGNNEDSSVKAEDLTEETNSET